MTTVQGRSESTPASNEGRKDIDTSEAAVTFTPTPYDAMTTKSLSRYFNVDYRSYHNWVKLVHPFGKGEAFDVGSASKKNKTRFTKGTYVPVTLD